MIPDESPGSRVLQEMAIGDWSSTVDIYIIHHTVYSTM